MSRIEDAYTYWDESQIVDDQVREWAEEHDFATDEAGLEAARQAMHESQSFWEWEWETVVYDLDNLMQEVNPEGRPWIVEGSNLGWQHRSGSTVKTFANAEELAHTFLTNFECSWYVYKKEGGFTITRISHDEPTGAHLGFWVTEQKDCPHCGEHYFDHDEHAEMERHGVCWRCLEYNQMVCAAPDLLSTGHSDVWWQCSTCKEWYCDLHSCVTALGLNVECYTCQDIRLEEEAA